jgi:hypothetical protein
MPSVVADTELSREVTSHGQLSLDYNDFVV